MANKMFVVGVVLALIGAVIMAVSIAVDMLGTLWNS